MEFIIGAYPTEPHIIDHANHTRNRVFTVNNVNHESTHNITHLKADFGDLGSWSTILHEYQSRVDTLIIDYSVTKFFTPLDI